jgi:hypothetical protein
LRFLVWLKRNTMNGTPERDQLRSSRLFVELQGWGVEDDGDDCEMESHFWHIAYTQLSPYEIVIQDMIWDGVEQAAYRKDLQSTGNWFVHMEAFARCLDLRLSWKGRLHIIDESERPVVVFKPGDVSCYPMHSASFIYSAKKGKPAAGPKVGVLAFGDAELDMDAADIVFLQDAVDPPVDGGWLDADLEEEVLQFLEELDVDEGAADDLFSPDAFDAPAPAEGDFGAEVPVLAAQPPAAEVLAAPLAPLDVPWVTCYLPEGRITWYKHGNKFEVTCKRGHGRCVLTRGGGHGASDMCGRPLGLIGAWLFCDLLLIETTHH